MDKPTVKARRTSRILKVLNYLQNRLDELKEDFHQFIGEHRNRLDQDLEKALFAEDKKELLLLVGSSTLHVSQVLEHRLNDRNPFDDIQLCKDVTGDMEFDSEDQDYWKEREGIIHVVIQLYSILDMKDKVKEAGELYYYN